MNPTGHVTGSGHSGRAARGVRPTAGATNFYGAIGIGINQPSASAGISRSPDVT